MVGFVAFQLAAGYVDEGLGERYNARVLRLQLLGH